jgi:pectinesterase
MRRSFVLRALALLGAGTLGAAPPALYAQSGPAAPAYDAVVDAGYTGTDGARVDGVARYRSIGGAVAAAPTAARVPYVVSIRNGRYREKLLVDRPGLHFVGESREGTVLTWDATADTKGPDGQPLGTRGSWTLKVVAPDFSLERMTVENGFDYPANYARAADDPARVANAQALAVALGVGSDRAIFRDCVLSGYQDTLFPDAGRSYFRGCTIRGNVDFIFGAGRAVFKDCDIVSLDRGTPRNNGYVTAASTPTEERYGLVFLNSRLKKATPAMAPASVYLGRPWHPSATPGIASAVVYIDCWMDDHIGTEGWTRMSSVDPSGTRIWYEPQDARFFEYGSTGPGALKGPGRRTLTRAQAQEYTVERVLGGWVPENVNSLLTRSR